MTKQFHALQNVIPQASGKSKPPKRVHQLFINHAELKTTAIGL
jgi:hypothetical protein